MDMSKSTKQLAGRVAIVTGAGRGSAKQSPWRTLEKVRRSSSPVVPNPNFRTLRAESKPLAEMFIVLSRSPEFARTRKKWLPTQSQRGVESMWW